MVPPTTLSRAHAYDADAPALIMTYAVEPGARRRIASTSEQLYAHCRTVRHTSTRGLTEGVARQLCRRSCPLRPRATRHRTATMALPVRLCYRALSLHFGAQAAYRRRVRVRACRGERERVLGLVTTAHKAAGTHVLRTYDRHILKASDDDRYTA